MKKPGLIKEVTWIGIRWKEWETGRGSSLEEADEESTDDDLTAIDGRREALEGRIQERYGYTKDRVRKEIEEWQRSFASQLNPQQR